MAVIVHSFNNLANVRFIQECNTKPSYTYVFVIKRTLKKYGRVSGRVLRRGRDFISDLRFSSVVKDAGIGIQDGILTVTVKLTGVNLTRTLLMRGTLETEYSSYGEAHELVLI